METNASMCNAEITSLNAHIVAESTCISETKFQDQLGSGEITDDPGQPQLKDCIDILLKDIAFSNGSDEHHDASLSFDIQRRGTSSLHIRLPHGIGIDSVTPRLDYFGRVGHILT